MAANPNSLYMPFENQQPDVYVVDTFKRNCQLEHENRELREAVRKLTRMVYIDSLTGLVNRRYFDAALKTEIGRATRNGTSLTLAICDVDRFKHFNDTFGHQVGDSVLRLVGKIMAAYCRRAGDIAARIGGEEFALLLPGIERADTKPMVDRLRRSIAAAPALESSTGSCRPVTISVGVTTFHAARPVPPEKLIRAADIALYKAKRSGRNRIRYCPV